MSAAVGQSDPRYRHVVFATIRPRPLNLGLESALREGPAAAGGVERPADEDAFLGWLFRECGLSASEYRTPGLRRRLSACLRALHANDLPDARRVLRRHPHLLSAAVDAVLLGVTEFFRDPATFECIARELASIEPGRPMRIWSAGCSEGAELYSVAMLLAESDRLDDAAELLGTDCRPEAVAHATAGVYTPIARRGLSDQRLQRFFEPVDDDDGRARASAMLRRRTTWRQANVLTGVEPGPWDLIACRNLAMYLRPDVSERLFANLATALRPGGLLVLGKAERPGLRTADVGVRLVQVGPCVYRRDGEP